MWAIVSKLLGSIIFNYAGMYMAEEMLKKPKNIFKRYNNIILILIMGVISSYIYKFTTGITRVGLNVLLISFVTKIIFKEENNKCFIISLILILIGVISETIFAIFIILILGGNLNILNEIAFGKFLFNIAIAITMILIYNVFKVKIYRIINEYKGNIPAIMLLSLCLFICITYSFKNIKFSVNKTAEIFNIISILTMIGLLYIVFIEKIKNKIANNEKKLLNKNIVVYENTVEKLRISQHENKNEISIIKNMILNKSEKLEEYLEDILSEKRIDEDVEIMLKLKNIESAVIKSLLYEKAYQIYHKKIKFIINVNVQENNLIKFLSVNKEKDICKVLGVLIDNAIDCVEQKKGYIMGVIIYSNKNSIGFDIFNNYDSIEFLENKPKYDINFLPNQKTRGNGLKIVKRIVQKYNDLSFFTEVDNNYITQKVIYKEHNSIN